MRRNLEKFDPLFNKHQKPMGLLKWITKLINERGSALIMEKRLAMKDDEIAKLQSQIRDLQTANEQEKFERDDVVFHKGIEFRRGIKTSGKWVGCCPKCHIPAQEAQMSKTKRKK